MIFPSIPENETDRLRELYRYELLDSAYEQEFDEIVQLASRVCNVPMSLITLIDSDRQWYKARIGIDGSQTERGMSFCAHTILDDKLLEVGDASTDERFHDNPYVTGDPYVRYYAGMPLITPNGYRLGALCVLDREPRHLDEEQTFALSVLSNQVVKLFELRMRNRQLQKIVDVQHRMMAIMAHDIRGPLSSLKMSYELKNSGIFTGEEAAEIDLMVPAQLEATIGLLNNVVDWGTLLLGQISAIEEPVHLHKVAADAIETYALAARSKGNRLKNNIQAGLLAGTKKRGITFILQNLIANANKYTPGGEITVDVQAGDTWLTLTVTDTGIGMSPGVVKAVNERTWAGTMPGTEGEKGSGLGLKLLFEYLDAEKGKIKIASQEGVGTTVTATLPHTGISMQTPAK